MRDKVLRDKTSIKSGLVSERLSRISMFSAIYIINNVLKTHPIFLKYDINRDTNSINFSVAINIPLCIIADIIKKSSYYFRYDYLLTIHIWSILDIRVNRNRKYVFPREYHNSRKHGGFIFKSKLAYKIAVLTHICLRFNGIDKSFYL